MECAILTEKEFASLGNMLV